MSTQIYIAVGDQNLIDAVNLMDPTPSQYCMLKDGESLLMPEPVIRRYHSRTKGTATQVDESRIITVSLHLQSNVSGDLVLAKVHQLRTKLRQARRGWGAGTMLLGTGVCIWARLWDVAPFTYLDVLDGAIKVTKQDFGASYAMEIELTLTCLPFMRGQSKILAASATLTNGISGSYFLPIAIPGDEEAITQVIVADTSPTGAINRIRLGRRSLDGMLSSDFTPGVVAAALGTATTHSDTTATGGSCIRGVVGFGWQQIAAFAGTASGLNYGLMDVLVRVKDSTIIVGQPTNVVGVPGTGGSLSFAAPTAFTFAISEVDGSGNETAASDPVDVVIGPGQTEIVFTWHDSGSPTNHNFYWIQTSGAGVGSWAKVATGSASATYTFSSIPGGGGIGLGGGSTAYPPPSANAAPLLPTEIMLGAALNVAGLPTGEILWGEPVTTQLGNSQWELLYGGTFPLPPIPLQEGGSQQNWQIIVAVKSQGSNTPNLDVDFALFLPHDEPQMVAEIPALASATKYAWILDTRRDDRTSGLLTSSGAAAGQVTPEGPFMLGPGGNLIIIAVEMAYGLSDITATYTVQVRYAPRYMDPLSAAA